MGKPPGPFWETFLAGAGTLPSAVQTTSQVSEQRGDGESLVDTCYAYVTDPRPSRNAHFPQLDEGGRFDLGDWRDVLEQMVLDGVDQRDDVADFVDYLTAGPVRAALYAP